MSDATPENATAHWCKLFEGLQQSTEEFYSRVATAVAALSIPALEVERVEYREGGALSGFRQYLRVRRRREVFDLCGAPFSNGFFFSWWFAETKPRLPKFAAVIICLVYLGILGACAEQFGMFQGPLVLVFLVPIILAIVAQLGKPEADDLILQLPLIGPIYERVFRPITYYRIDTSQMYQQAVEKAVEDVIDEIIAAKGIRPLTELERKPVMRDFFKK